MHHMYFFERKCESLKTTERDFDEFVLQCFELIMAYHLFVLYISIYVYEKLVCLLSFVFIIVYCDSISKSQDLFVMSEKKT